MAYGHVNTPSNQALCYTEIKSVYAALDHEKIQYNYAR